MRIALAQIDATVGDFAGNARRIRDAATRARASLVVFPELVVCGYMPRDLLEDPAFVDACERELDALRRDRSLPPLLVGCPVRAPGAGKPLWNAAVLLRGGEATVVAKRLLPTYDVFDEKRYFRPGDACDPIDVDGVKVGVTICEDVWTGALYESDPVGSLVGRGARAIVNLSASPYERGKPGVRRAILEHHARRHGVPCLLCNLVGGNDQLIFDGNSFAVDGAGRLVAHAAPFREDVAVTDLSAPATPPDRADDVGDAIVLGVRAYFAKTGFADAILGMSGGIDSSLVACLAAEALGAAHVTGVAMPGPYSAPESEADARALARSLGIRFEVAPIGDAYDTILRGLGRLWGDRPFDVAEENLQARLRGVILMSLANKLGALVLVPSNKSELAMGYCTMYGDMVGALAPIADLYKGEVYELARRHAAAIPARSVARAPTAELRPNQTDQDTLPPYETLDAVLRLHLEERLRPEEIVAAGFAPAVVRQVLRGVAASEFKRQQSAVVLKVSAKAFGLGRRHPIAERFRGGTA